jgi:hypothetical protein
MWYAFLVSRHEIVDHVVTPTVERALHVRDVNGVVVEWLLAWEEHESHVLVYRPLDEMASSER